MNECVKREILQNVLKRAPFEGWTDAMLHNAAEECGGDDFMLYRSFPGKLSELIEYYAGSIDKEMAAAAEQEGISGLRIRDRIAALVMIRLSLYAPHKEAVRRLLAYLALPQHAALSLRLLYRTVDVMWRLAGDTATDYNFYTKRIMLSGVYVTTLMQWIQNESDDLATTEAFLSRRIEHVMAIEKTKHQMKESLKKWPPKWAI